MRKIYTLIAFCFLTGQYLFGLTNFSYTDESQEYFIPTDVSKINIVLCGTANLASISNNKTTSGSGICAYTSSIAGITAGTKNNVHSYAKSYQGTGYGSVETFAALKNSQTITFTDNFSSKTYGDDAIKLTGTASSGLAVSYESSNTSVATVSGSTITIVGHGISKITASQAGNISYNAATPVSLTLTVAKKVLTVTCAVVSNKVYDWGLAADITGGTLVGKVGADAVTLATATTGTFASINVGNGIVVTSAMTLKGAAAENYTLIQPTLSANITPKLLTVTEATDANKTFDGEMTVGISGVSLVGVLGPDEVSLTSFSSITFADNNEAAGIRVTSIMTLTGLNAGNYSLVQPALSPNILANQLSGTDAFVEVKVYPNPFVSELFIDTENLSANAIANLYDLNGRKLMNIRLDGQAISLGHLTSGVYLLQVDEKSFRIVKQ